MQKWHLKHKLNLYLEGNAGPDTVQQIEEWLSDPKERSPAMPENLLQEEERTILDAIRAETEYPLFYPSQEDRNLKQVVLVGIIVCCIFLVALLLMRH